MKKSLQTLLFLSSPSILIGIVAAVLMCRHIPTHVEVELIADHLSFTVGTADSLQDGKTLKSIEILKSIGLESITFDEFTRVELHPVNLVEAGSSTPSAPGSAERVQRDLNVVITGPNKRLYPAVTFESINKGSETSSTTAGSSIYPHGELTLELYERGGKKKEDLFLNAQMILEVKREEPGILGTLDHVSVSPGAEVTFEVAEATAPHSIDLSLKVEKKAEPRASSTRLTIHKPFDFKMAINNCSISGLPNSPSFIALSTYKGKLLEMNPHINVSSTDKSLGFIVTVPAKEYANVFPRGGFPVTALGLTRKTTKGIVSTLLENARIRYPDNPAFPEVTVNSTDIIELGQLKGFHIREMNTAQEHGGIRLLMNGFAGEVSSQASGYHKKKDHRLTSFSSLWKNPRLVALFTIVVWVFGTTLAGYRVFGGDKKGQYHD